MLFYLSWAMYMGVIALFIGSYVNYLSARLTEKRETEVLG